MRIIDFKVSIGKRKARRPAVNDVALSPWETSEPSPIQALHAPYSVRSDGHVYKNKTIMRSFNQHNGYCRISLIEPGGKKKNHMVHRLIAAAFFGPIPDGMVVDHINECRTDNRPENLEYVTHSENERRKRAKFEGRKGKNFRNNDAILSHVLPA